MTVDIHFSNVHVGDIRRWIRASAQKENVENAILVGATLGMIAVLVVRFYTLFAI
jgi:hypothetical protein